MRGGENGLYREQGHVRRSRTVRKGKFCRWSANMNVNKMFLQVTDKQHKKICRLKDDSKSHFHLQNVIRTIKTSTLASANNIRDKFSNLCFLMWKIRIFVCVYKEIFPATLYKSERNLSCLWVTKLGSRSTQRSPSQENSDGERKLELRLEKVRN